jgi:acid stress chaperone HdeB
LAHSFDALISRVSKTIIGFAADKGEDAMKIRVFLFCALLALVLPATARAQVTVDITKITCRQFLTGRVVPTKTIAIWFSGYYNGKSGNTMIDMGTIRPNAEKVRDYCALHQDETVMKAAEATLGAK